MRNESEILRKQYTEFDSSFLGLKKKGLEHIQNLSGDLWTDYNHHDPGITILEQVCYALTEIAYQEDLDISDLITGPGDGEPNFEKLAMVMPNHAYSMHPIKPKDYSRMLYDRIDGVVNAWLTPVERGGDKPDGLYHLFLNIIDKTEYEAEPEIRRIKKEAADIFHSNRNLGEDLEEISILNDHKIEVLVKSRIVLATSRDPSAVLAEIVVNIEECLRPRLQFVAMDKLLQKGYSFDEIFEGPELINGIIPSGIYHEKPTFVDSNQVSEFIQRVEDVDSVRSLSIVHDGKPSSRITIDKNSVLLYLFDIEDFSGTISYITDYIELIQKGSERTLQIDPEVFERTYRTIRTALRRTLPVRNLNLKPAASKKPISKPEPYYSIQNDFPAIYGINKFGIPDHQSDLRKAQALQLKAYLYLFEQHLANGMELPHSLKSLFSIEKDSGSYPFVQLDDSNIPGISKLFFGDELQGEEETAGDDSHPDNQAHTPGAQPALYNLPDDSIDRKSRAVDYLISLYGESCSLYSLSLFNYYHTESEFKKWLLELKISFLTSIADLNYNRSAAFNYTAVINDADDAPNISGMEMKARILLGVEKSHKNLRQRSCLSAFEFEGLKLKSTSSMDHVDCYSPGTQGGNALKINNNDREVENSDGQVEFLEGMSLHKDAYDELLKDSTVFGSKTIDDEILKSGILLSNYRVIPVTNEGKFQVLLHSRVKSKMQWRILGHTSGKKRACDLVIAHLKKLRELSYKSEDFILLEHILLRRKNPDDQVVEYGAEEADKAYERVQKERAKAERKSGVEKDFYSHRISIFLPAWTARFSDPGYRSLVAETFNLLIPAHLICRLYWLSPEEMCDFEIRYNKWFSQISRQEKEDQILDDQSDHLSNFIKNLDLAEGKGDE